VFGTGSGRSALYLALKALQTLRPGRDIVAIPGYTCFSVAAAVVRAGLKIHLVCVDPLTFDFQPAELEILPRQRLLCVIATNLFGFPNDVRRLKAFAAEADAFVVDDAAQAFGATRDGAMAGMAGDVGIYSMGRGKPLFGMGGGVITAQSDATAAAVRDQLSTCRKSGWAQSAEALMTLAAYSVFFHPALYRLADAMPFLGLGVTEFNPSFEVRTLSRAARAILAQVTQQLDEFDGCRKRNASLIKDAVGQSRFVFPEPPPGCVATYSRVPVLAPDADVRNRTIGCLRRSGIGASTMYPSAICDIPGIDVHMDSGSMHCPQSEMLSGRLFTLPTHAFVTDRDISRIATVLKTC
jgi:dTDP-4-amino-4,6-dideoxygalactose transaminase